MFPIWIDILDLCVVLCKLTYILPASSTELVYLSVDGHVNQDLLLENTVGAALGSWWPPQWLNDSCQYCYSEWHDVFVENASLYTTFLLFTSESGFNNYTTLNMTDFPQSLYSGGFDATRDTKIVIHGWYGNGTNFAAQALVEGYLNSTEDVNIISVSWPALSEALYTMSAVAVAPVGRYTGQMLDRLVSELGVSTDSFHLVGHSLGAHVCGVAGETFSSGNLSRISGKTRVRICSATTYKHSTTDWYYEGGSESLDPALPLFLDSPTEGRLDSSDAQFVDVIHSAGGYLGIYGPVGDIDFYPNGGTPIQPGCGFDIGYCSHGRSYEYFAESVSSYGFVATKCDSWSDYKKDVCSNNVTTFMGEHVNRSLTGKFYLHTNSKSPFAAWNASLSLNDELKTD